MSLGAGVALCALGLGIGASAFGRGGGGHFQGGGPHSFAGHGFAHQTFGGRNVGRQHFVSHESHGRLAGHDQFHGTARVATVRQDAHIALAAQHFRGLSNFSHTGFNRNAFGNERAWNGWGGRFWGVGWNNWGTGWGGWAGPVFWPFLFGDVFSFTFWPYDYYDPFWAFGPDFIFASIFAPGPFLGVEYGYGPDFYTYGGFPNIYYGTRGVRRVPKSIASGDLHSSALAKTDAEAMQGCGGVAPGVNDLPIEQIRQMVRPTPEQVSALEELGAALSKAKEAVAASCPKAIPLTPIGRLDAVQQRLDAMVQAVQLVRAPAEQFYGFLSDDQRQRLLAMNSRKAARQLRPTLGGSNLASICTQPEGGLANLPVQHIEQLVEPNAQQQDALNELKKASEDAARALQATCPPQMPDTPAARLDAVEKRLDAMENALRTIRPKLDEFYASLSDEQKARFNTLGPPPQSASPHQSDGGKKG